MLNLLKAIQAMNCTQPTRVTHCNQSQLHHGTLALVEGRRITANAIKRRSGATSVEMAMTLPLLFLLLFGALELSHANMLLNSAEAAAYEGARRGIVPGANSEACIAATQRVLDVMKVRSSHITVNPSNLSTSQARTVTVTVDIPYSANSIIAPRFTGSLRIVRSCELNREIP